MSNESSSDRISPVELEYSFHCPSLRQGPMSDGFPDNTGYGPDIDELADDPAGLASSVTGGS